MINIDPFWKNLDSKMNNVNKEEQLIKCKHLKIVNISFSEANPKLACAECGKLKEDIDKEYLTDFQGWFAAMNLEEEII